MRPRQPQNSEPRLSSRKITTLRRGRAGSPATRRRMDWPSSTNCVFGFGQQAARALVGFILRQGLVERGIVEVVRPGRGDEGERAVVGDFVQGAVVAHMRALEIEGRARATRPAPRPPPDAAAGTLAEKGRSHICPNSRLAANSQPRLRTSANRQDHADVVRLPDVDEDLPGIEQVIHGDGVEARLELVEEEELDEQQEDLHEPEDKAAAQEQHPMPPRPEPPVRHDQHPEQQRDRLRQRRKEVPMKPAQESEQDVGRRQPGRLEGQEQDQPEQEPGGQQREKPKAGEAVARPSPRQLSNCERRCSSAPNRTVPDSGCKSFRSPAFGRAAAGVPARNSCASGAGRLRAARPVSAAPHGHSPPQCRLLSACKTSPGWPERSTTSACQILSRCGWGWPGK